MTNSDNINVTIKSSNRHKKILYFFIVFLSLVIFISLASNYFFWDQLNKSTRQLYAQTALNDFGKTIIEKGGDVDCAKAVDAKAKELFDKNETGTYVFDNTSQMVSYSIEDIRPEGGVSYVSMNVVGYREKTCQIATETVTHWVDECPLVADKIFSDLKTQEPLKQRIYHLSDDKKKNSLFLIPIENGCISIKKEV